MHKVYTCYLGAIHFTLCPECTNKNGESFSSLAVYSYSVCCRVDVLKLARKVHRQQLQLFLRSQLSSESKDWEICLVRKGQRYRRCTHLLTPQTSACASCFFFIGFVVIDCTVCLLYCNPH